MTKLRLVLLGLAILSAIIAGTLALQKAVRPEPPSTAIAATAPEGLGEPDATRHQIATMQRAFEEKLGGAPEYAAFFDRLKSVFPAEYESFLSSLADRSAATGDIGSADLVTAEAVRSLRLSRGILAAKAGPAALKHVFELQLAILQALAAKDPRLCVNFLYGSESAGFLEFSAQNRKLIAGMGMASIDAIQDGELRQVDRDAPTAADFDSLEEALRAKGLETPEIDALLDGKIGNPAIAEDRLCRAGQIYLETLAAMPEESRLRIYGLAVELMARS